MTDDGERFLAAAPVDKLSCQAVWGHVHCSAIRDGQSSFTAASGSVRTPDPFASAKNGRNFLNT
jgi:hypothetical protein